MEKQAKIETGKISQKSCPNVHNRTTYEASEPFEALEGRGPNPKKSESSGSKINFFSVKFSICIFKCPSF